MKRCCAPVPEGASVQQIGRSNKSVERVAYLAGHRGVWLQPHREGVPGLGYVARCTVVRLMRELRLAGAVRGKVKKTTIADPHHQRAADLVARRFAPLAPDR